MLKSTKVVQLAAVLIVGAGSAQAAATLNGVTVFATAPTGTTAPDSIAIGDGSVFVAYTGGTSGRAGTGTSTIVRYSQTGAVQATYTVAGNADGLKVNPVTGIVYVLQNQDANSTISLIDPTTNTVSSPLSYASPPYVYGAAGTHGYDDAAFRNGQVFISATNPAVPGDPIVQLLNNGNAPAGTLTTTTILTAGQVNGLPDADSLKTKPNGDLVLTDGNGGSFITIANPGTGAQTAISTPVLLAGTKVGSLDDVLYPSGTQGVLYLADAANNRVLALSVSNLDVTQAFVSLDGANQLVTVDATGIATPFYTGAGTPLGAIASPHGLDFQIPEPAAMTILGTGLLGLFATRRRRG